MPAAPLSRPRLTCLTGLGCLSLIGVALLLGACAHDDSSTTSTTTTVTFSTTPVFQPNPPAAGVLITVSFLLYNTSTTNTTVGSLPYAIEVDGSLAVNAMTPELPPNTTTEINAPNIQIANPGVHTITVILDPANTNGDVNPSENTSTTSVTVVQTVNN